VIVVAETAVWVALLMAIWTAIASFAGGATGRAELVTSGERGLRVTFGFVALAALGLLTALLTRDFSIQHVASFTSANLPLAQTITALWAGRDGALLLWTLLLGGCSVIAVHTNRERHAVLVPYLAGMLGLVLALALAALAFAANPFERLDWVPLDGRGMHPQLQNIAMALHPPALYLGYAASIIPFAFAAAARITGRRPDDWLAAVRPWVIAAWLFTTVGILTGMWWAYAEPDWNGFWVWHAVGNGSVLPWLVNTVLLHVIVLREKRVAPERTVYGGYVAYGGALLFLAALVGFAFRSEHEITLRTGDAAELRDPYGRSWRFVSEGVSRYDVLNRHVTAVALAAYRGDMRVGLLASERRQHVDSRGALTFEPASESAIIGSPLQDVYVALAGVAEDDVARLRISFNPLVWWVWFGGGILLLGGVLAVWPTLQARRAPAGDA